MRALILLEGDDATAARDAVRDHPAVTCTFKTIGEHCLAILMDGDMSSLRNLIGILNKVPGIRDGETILELEFGLRQPPVQADGHFRAILLFTEHGGKDPDMEQSFEEIAKTIPGVVEAFSLLGRHDDLALIKFDDHQELQHLVKELESDSIKVVDIILEQS